MVGVQLSGGLGNQMFEYALYLKLKSMGKDVRIDDVTCYGAQEKQRVNQLSVFGVSYERMTKQEYEQITDSSMSPLHRARRLLCGRKDLSYREASPAVGIFSDGTVFCRYQRAGAGIIHIPKSYADKRIGSDGAADEGMRVGECPHPTGRLPHTCQSGAVWRNLRSGLLPSRGRRDPKKKAGCEIFPVFQ